MADLPPNVVRLLTALGDANRDTLNELHELLKKPDRALAGLIHMLALKPVPSFTKPTAYSQGVGAVTFALSANLAWANKYTLLVYKNEAPVPPPATVMKGMVAVPYNQIEITGTPAVSGDLVIPATYFQQANYGPGNYLLKIQANFLMSTVGYGIGTFEIELT